MAGYTTKCRGDRGFYIFLKLSSNLLRIGILEGGNNGFRENGKVDYG
jgi:hypothetical protein